MTTTIHAGFCGRCGRPLTHRRSTKDGYGPVCAEHCVDAYTLDFTISVDTREQQPYTFEDFKCDADRHHKPLIVPAKREMISAGDYTISGEYLSNGMPPIVIERKSLADLYSTLGQGRERFERELQLLSCCSYAAVVIEACWDEIEFKPPPRSKLHPKTVIRSMLAWSERYGIHVWAMPGRRAAEKTTFELLRRYWADAYGDPITAQQSSRTTDRLSFTPQDVTDGPQEAATGRETGTRQLEGCRT